MDKGFNPEMLTELMKGKGGDNAKMLKTFIGMGNP